MSYELDFAEFNPQLFGQSRDDEDDDKIKFRPSRLSQSESDEVEDDSGGTNDEIPSENSDDDDDNDDDKQNDNETNESSLERFPKRHSGGSSSKRNLRKLRDEFDEDPELYGIRRSSRSRKETAFYQVKDEKKKLNRRRRIISDDSSRENSSDNSSSSGSSDFVPRKKRNIKQRKSNICTRGNVVSYKEILESDSDDYSSDDKYAKKKKKGNGSSSNTHSIMRQKPSNRQHPLLGGVPLRDSFQNRQPLQKPRGPLIRSSMSVSNKLNRSASKISEDESDAESVSKTNNEEYFAAPQPELDEINVIEEVLTHRFGPKDFTGDQTTIYNIKNPDNASESEIKNEDKSSADTKELQFYIKWKGWSHIHSTWENYASLSSRSDIGGLKKVDIYKAILREREAWKGDASVEELEAALFEEDRNEQLLHDKQSIERIVTHIRTKNAANNDYLVKWKSLEYYHCTWEDGGIISRLFPNAIQEYERRSRSLKTPNKKCEALRVRPKFVPNRTQPEYIGRANRDLKLRDYQIEGVNWLGRAWCRGNSVILADEMGLGKTVQTIGFLSYLFNEHNLYGPFLLVVPLSTIGSWQSEFEIWAPDMNVIIYTGNALSRQTIREYEWHFPGKSMVKLNVCITTYEILLKDKNWLGQVKWALLGVDEAHRLKNESSQLYKALFSFDTNSRLLITGTPLQNSLRELWALLYFIMPNKFGVWEEFEEMYSVDESGAKTAFNQLHKALEPFLLRRVKKDVEKSLPAKTEQILRVGMASLQQKYYKWILAKNYEMLSKEVHGHVTSFVNIVMELKKCCNHPHLITRPTEAEEYGLTREEILRRVVKASGKVMLLDKLLLRLKEKGHRVLIFSQMVMMLDIIADYLNLRGWAFQRLDGSIRGDLRKQAIDHFNAEGSTDFCFLLSTRAGGLGVNLATADTVIIFDSDWNPQNDLQAQARAHRIGQTKQVSVYRLVTKNSVEEKIIEKAKKKMVLDHLVIQRMDTTGRSALSKSLPGSTAYAKSQPFNKEELTEILKFGACDLFKGNDDSSQQEDEVDLDDIFKRAEMRDTEAEAESQNPASDLLSSFKVVTLENLEDEEIVYMDSKKKKAAWSQIIPQDMIEKVKEEESNKMLIDLELGPRQRRQVNHFKAGVDGSDDSSSSSEEEERRKSGKMTDKEIRALVRAIKKFAKPMERIETIIAETEIPEQNEKEVRDVIEKMINGCRKALDEASSNTTDTILNIVEDSNLTKASNDDHKSSKPVVFQFGRISIPAKSLINSIDYLDALHTVMPSTHEERLKLELPFQTKLANWSCEWDSNEDAKLLVGVYEHGNDNWEAIKMDPELGLTSKILPTSSSDRPQASHLRTRLDYLLKMLKRGDDIKAGRTSSATSSMKPKPTEPKPKKESTTASKSSKSKKKETVDTSAPKPKSKEFIDSSDTSGSSDDEKAVKPKEKKKGKVPQKREADKKVDNSHDTAMSEPKKKKKKPNEDKVKVKLGSSQTTPMSVNKADEDSFFNHMSGPIFNECKSKMRSIRKHIKKLEESNGKDNHILEEYLLKIGDHINKIIHEYTDKKEVRKWRNYLWYFVNFFTQLTDKELHKIYKKAYKIRGEITTVPSPDDSQSNTSATIDKPKPHSTTTKLWPPDDLEDKTSSKSKHHHRHHHHHQSKSHHNRHHHHNKHDKYSTSENIENSFKSKFDHSSSSNFSRPSAPENHRPSTSYSRDRDGDSHGSRYDNAYNRRPNRPYHDRPRSFNGSESHNYKREVDSDKRYSSSTNNYSHSSHHAYANQSSSVGQTGAADFQKASTGYNQQSYYNFSGQQHQNATYSSSNVTPSQQSPSIASPSARDPRLSGSKH